ncbi:MAG: APC family permease [Candidatus Micrarchaeia archaeon]
MFTPKVRLRREFGLLSATVFGVSLIVGAGIYTIIGVATSVAGSGIWLSFLAAAIIALFTGLSYAELASMFPRTGASFVYVLEAFRNRLLGFVAGWLVMFEVMVSVAAIALAFGGYLASVLPVPILISAFGVIAFFSLVNIIGIKESIRLNIMMFLMEIGGLLFIIAAGFLFGGIQMDFMDFTIPSIFGGAALVFFAMIGFDMIAEETEETKDARRTIPKAIILSILICGVLYVLFAIAALMLVGPELLGASTAPVKDIVVPLLGEYSYIFAFIALASTANTVMICLITSSRLLYGISKERAIPGLFSKVNKRFSTPHFAIFLSFAVSVLFLLLADLAVVAEIANFAALAVFTMVNLSAIQLRLEKPKAKRAFKIPFSIGRVPIIPVLGALFSVFLISFLSADVLVYGSLVLAAGAIVYLVQGRKKAPTEKTIEKKQELREEAEKG